MPPADQPGSAVSTTRRPERAAAKAADTPPKLAPTMRISEYHNAAQHVQPQADGRERRVDPVQQRAVVQVEHVIDRRRVRVQTRRQPSTERILRVNGITRFSQCWRTVACGPARLPLCGSMTWTGGMTLFG